jgi:hypothetical protein
LTALARSSSGCGLAISAFDHVFSVNTSEYKV